MSDNYSICGEHRDDAYYVDGMVHKLDGSLKQIDTKALLAGLMLDALDSADDNEYANTDKEQQEISHGHRYNE